MMLCFIISTFFYKEATSVKMISQLLLLSILTEAVVEVYKALNYEYYLIYHLFTPIEFCYIALYFYFSATNKNFKRTCITFIAIFTLISIIAILVSKNLGHFPRFLSYMECFFIIILAILALLQIEVHPDKSIYELSDFWFSIAFLFFNSALFIVLFFNHEADPEIKRIFGIINRVSNCVLYGLLSVGFLCLRKKSSSF